jgi:uncharacterized protein YkwD
MKVKLFVLVILIQISVFINVSKVGLSHQVTSGHTSNLDDRPTEMEAVPFIENGHTYVPVRHLALTLGVPESKIVWEPSSRTVTLTKDNVKTVMTIESNIIHTNGRPGKIDAVPLIRNGLTYLPAQYVAEAFGYEVSLKSNSEAVLRASSGTGTQINSLDLCRVEQVLFNRINENRLAAGLTRVEWDETAAKTARRFAGEMAQNNFISHWNLSGKKPQQRYTEAGGIYGTTENVCLNWLQGYEPNQSLIQNNLLKIHEKMMAEVPPNDGHRVNILEPHHTHVGVGIACAKQDDGSITIAFIQEFTNHCAELKDIPQVLKPRESFTVNGIMLQPELKLDSIILLWEEAPRPMSIEELKITRSYSSPDLESMISYALKDWPMAYYPYAAATGNKLLVDGSGHFMTTLQAGVKEGLNYLQVWFEDTAGNKFMGNEFVIEIRK